MPLTGVTVLAVDDNEAHNYAMARMLEHAGCKVLRAQTGTEALVLAQQQPSAVLLDINLPDINGFEVCRRLRANSHTKDIAVIFITAEYHDANTNLLAEQAGAKALLFYPVEIDQLLAVVQGQIAKAATGEL